MKRDDIRLTEEEAKDAYMKLFSLRRHEIINYGSEN